MSAQDTTTPPLQGAWFPAFVLLLVFLPLPFGSNRPWAADLFGVLSGLLLFFALWDYRTAPPSGSKAPRRRIMFSAIGFTSVIIWAFFQAVPWTPQSWHHPMWQEAASQLGPVAGTISLDPSAFPESLVRLLGYIACFLIAFIGGRDSDRAAQLIRGLSLAGVVYAIYGLLAQSSGTNTILWFKKWAYEGFLTSTFVNKNSYAAYAGMGLMCSLGLLWNNIRKLQISDPVLARQSKAAAWLASLELKHLALALPSIIMLGALALTGSRGGIGSSLLGALVLLIALAINRRWKPRYWASFAVGFFLLFLLFVSMGGDGLIARMEDSALGEDSALRLSGYELEIQAIKDNPWLGFGLNSFEPAFRLYRDASFPIWFHHAHNDYLELAMDLGLPMAFIFLTSWGLLVSCCLQGIWKRRRHALYPAIAVGSTLLLAAHSLVDFSLQMPAIAATYAALLGVGVAQSWSSREGGDKSSSLD